MLDGKPRRGQHIIYEIPRQPETRKEYVVMGVFRNHNEILNITSPEAWKRDKGESHHTQVIWTHPEGPNPNLSFKEKEV